MGLENFRNWHRGSVWIAVVAVGALLLMLRLMTLGFEALGSPEVIPPGTALTVRLVRPLTSQSARLGDVFEAWVVSARAAKGAPIVPQGAQVEGRCVAVRAGEGVGRPGYLRLALSGLRDPHGHFAPLETTTFSQWGSSAVEFGLESIEVPVRKAPPPQPETTHLPAPSQGSSDAVVTPEAPLTFVLLKPAEVAGRLWKP